MLNELEVFRSITPHEELIVSSWAMTNSLNTLSHKYETIINEGAFKRSLKSLYEQHKYYYLEELQ